MLLKQTHSRPITVNGQMLIDGNCRYDKTNHEEGFLSETAWNLFFVVFVLVSQSHQLSVRLPHCV